jgi:hypothetical protein
VASRKKHRPSGQQIEISVTRIPADEARVRIILEALAGIGLAYLRARQQSAAAPQREGPQAGDSGGVA